MMGPKKLKTIRNELEAALARPMRIRSDGWKIGSAG
jgi:hypothetical protein